MNVDEVIKKVSWITTMKSTPPLKQSFIEEQYIFFENQVRFLQNNGFTTRIILAEGERANDESEIKISDLTEDGLRFYLFGIRKWVEKYDRAKDGKKVILDYDFIKKKLDEFLLLK